MGGTASKTARQLPKTVPTTTRSLPEWANKQLPAEPPLPNFQPPPTTTAQSSASSSSPASSSASAAYPQDALSHGRMESGSGISRDEPRGAPIGRSHTKFSGDKDDQVRRDGLDPDFAANLSRLGPVSIHDAGKFMPSQAAAQRTLNSRRDELVDATATPPPGHLTAPLLNQLFDELKAAKSDAGVKRVYDKYRMKGEDMEVLRRWVNSPSVGDVEVVNVEGEEVTQMKALWVDGK